MTQRYGSRFQQTAHPATRRRRPTLETLEQRVVPAGTDQVQATGVFDSIIVSTEDAFESNYKVQSDSSSVTLLANLVSSFLHSQENALAGELALPTQNALAQTLLTQMSGYVTQEVNTFETWYFNATTADEQSDLLLTQLDALTLSFKAVEQTATPLFVQELTTGVAVANSNSGFSYVTPAFLGGTGVALPSTTPSIIDPSYQISVMNNDMINQLFAAATTIEQTTLIALGASANPAPAGQPVTFTATVTPLVAAAGTPTGTVTFNVNGTMTQVALTNGQASLTVPSFSAGSDSVAATYTPATGVAFQASGTSLTLTVNSLVATTTTLTSSSGTVSATVAPASGTATPTGTVTFYVDGAAQAPVALANGTATLPAAATPTDGTHTIAATYSGDTNFLGSLSSSISFPDT